MTKPVSLLELSAQARLIWVEDAAVAVRLPGAAGRAVVIGTTLELAESPPALKARTR
jgi:hypothetical protein